MIHCHARTGDNLLVGHCGDKWAKQIEVDTLFRYGDLPITAVVRHDLRICLPNPDALRHSLSHVRQSLARVGNRQFERLWLDIGTSPICDWLAFRRMWEIFCNVSARIIPAAEGIGLAAIALIMPGDSAGYLSAEYLYKISKPFLYGRKLWAGIPVTPLYTNWYLSKNHFVNGNCGTVFDTFRCLGIKVQAESLKFLETTWEALDDLPGMDRAERSVQFLGLLNHFESVRFEKEDFPLAKHLTRNMVEPSEDAVETHAKKPPASSIKQQPIDKEKFIRATRTINLLYDNTVINHLELVELILLLEGRKKVVRTTGSLRRIESIKHLAEACGLSWNICTSQKHFRKDRGKGGWTNLYNDRAFTGRRVPQYLIYIAQSQTAAEEALLLEARDDESFGELLGYPECCRNAFTRNFPTSLDKQGDLVPIVADQTTSSAPWPFLLNIAPRYFEECLVSFYPCSYTCPNALEIAVEAYTLINYYLPDYGRRLRKIFCSAVLYTEYRGVYLFPWSRLDGEFVSYDPRELMMTTSNRIGALLKMGNRILFSAPDHIAVMKNVATLGVLKGENVRFMVFGDEKDHDSI